MMRYLLTTLGVLFVATFLGCAVLAAYMLVDGWPWVSAAYALVAYGSLGVAEIIDTRLES